MNCSKCKLRLGELSIYLNGKYYSDICRTCVNNLQTDSVPTSASAEFNRRRDYEDMAQDTVQPWDAGGKPNVEFFRLYPESAEKQFSASEIEELKRKI